MEIVNDKVLYHISKIKNSKKFYPGDILKTEGYNPFFACYDEQDVLFNESNLVQGLTYYWHYARETVLEEIRKEVNPELPSRLRSLWLCDENSIEYWMSVLGYCPNTHQVLRVLVNGKLFKCDPTFIEGNPKKLNDIRRVGKKYWNGEIIEANKIEYLLEGTITVLEEINFKYEPLNK